MGHMPKRSLRDHPRRDAKQEERQRQVMIPPRPAETEDWGKDPHECGDDRGRERDEIGAVEVHDPIGNGVLMRYLLDVEPLPEKRSAARHDCGDRLRREVA